MTATATVLKTRVAKPVTAEVVTPATDYNTLSLEQLAAAVKVECRRTATSAWTLGKMLLAVKEKVGHGNFDQWKIANCPGFSNSTLARFMKLASKITSADDVVGLGQEYRKVINGNKDRIGNRAKQVMALVEKGEAMLAGKITRGDLVALFAELRTEVLRLLPTPKAEAEAAIENQPDSEEIV